MLTRVSSVEPRPVGTVPECVPLPRHTLDEDSPANGNVSRAGDCCGEGGLGSSRRWHDHLPEQLRVEHSHIKTQKFVTCVGDNHELPSIGCLVS